MKLYMIFLVGLLYTNVFPSSAHDFKQEHLNSKQEHLNSNVTIFVSSSGSDSLSCGQKENPCKSLKFALEIVGNAASVYIKLMPGVYSFESVKLECSVGDVKNVVIEGLRKSTVQIGLSADIIQCNVTFAYLQWSNSANPILINSVISTITIINSTISHIGFSLLSSGSRISLINSIITECTGWQPLFPLITTSGVTGFDNEIELQNITFSHNKSPLISIKMTPFAIKDVHLISNVVSEGEVILHLSGTQGKISESTFTKNVGTMIKVFGESVVNMTRNMFDSNIVLFGSLLDIGQGSSLKASMCSFIKSYGMAQGPVVKIRQGSRDVNFTNCHFGCNQVNGSTGVTPVKNSGKRVMTCSNCTTDHQCPVFCTSGKYVVSNIMCLLCPSGSYSPGSGFNITTFACKKCKPGYYSTKEGSNICSPCKPGSFAAKPGSTMCRVCKNSLMTSNEGQSSCSELTTSFILLTVFVSLLILVPLVVLFVQYLQTKSTFLSKAPKHSHRLFESGNISIQTPDKPIHGIAQNS